jgi:AcrR family transcriptional regulator
MDLNKKKIQSEQSVRHIIASTIGLMATNGYGNTSISDISRATGLTKGALYYHFTSKDKLFENTLRHIAQRLQEKLIERNFTTESSAERISQLFNSFSELVEENEHYLLIVSSITPEIDNKEVSFAYPLTEMFTELSKYIERIIEQGQAAGEINTDFDGKIISLNILGVMFGTALPWVLNKSNTNYHVILQSQKEIILKSILI